MVAIIEVIGVIVVALLAFIWLRSTSLYMAHRRSRFHPGSPVMSDREKLMDHRGARFKRNMWGPLPKHGKTDTGFRKRRP
jgi:hypothetical protein